MTLNGSHVIQKRDLLQMLDPLPQTEYIAVELDGLPDGEDDEPVYTKMPEAPIDLDELRQDSARAGRPKSAEALIEALEERVKDLEEAWPKLDDLKSERTLAFEKVRDVMAINSVRRCNGRTHLICGI